MVLGGGRIGSELAASSDPLGSPIRAGLRRANVASPRKLQHLSAVAFRQEAFSRQDVRNRRKVSSHSCGASHAYV